MSPEPVKLALSLNVSLPQHIYERHLPSSPFVVGEHLADQVMDYVQKHGLGYYPALEYFELQGGVDNDLLDAAGHISWFDCKLVREELQRKLRPAFRDIVFDSLQTVAFTMPGVRPGQLNARHALIRHFTPDTVKVGLTATTLENEIPGGALTEWAQTLLYRWLKDSFCSMEVTSARELTVSATATGSLSPQQHDK